MNMSYFNNKMLELIPGIFVIPGNTNIGVITDKKDSITEVYIVDSGNTEVDGEYILETLDEYFKFSNIFPYFSHYRIHFFRFFYIYVFYC